VDLHLSISFCAACKGSKAVVNPAWNEYLVKLSPAELEAGVTPPVAKTITCPTCLGVGFKCSQSIFQLADILATIQAARSHKREF
jgi:hypothetical protein